MKYAQPELLFHPIYSDQALLNIPLPVHKSLLQYHVAHPSLMSTTPSVIVLVILIIRLHIP